MSKSCKSDACIVHDTFDRLSSTSLVGTGVSYVLNYGTGKVNGEWVTDNVAFAGYNVNMHFLSADTLSYHFNNYPMDGILGLARVPEPEHPGFIHSLVNQGLLNSNTFAVNLHRMSDQTNDGSIVFGGVDPSKFSGNITYVPTVADNSIWGISVGDAGFNGQKAGLGGRTAVIDTGTSYAFMPEEDAKKFYALLPEATVSEDGGSYTVPCDTTIPAQFTFGGVTYEVSAKDWVGGKNGDGSNTCTSNIYSRDASGQGSWLLGDTFLKNVYAVFDMGNNQIGFAHKSIGSGEPATSPAKTSGTFNSFPLSLL